jgi:hypothetical protein
MLVSDNLEKTVILSGSEVAGKLLCETLRFAQWGIIRMEESLTINFQL